MHVCMCVPVFFSEGLCAEEWGGGEVTGVVVQMSS